MTNTLYIPIADGSTSLNGLVAMFINNWCGNKTLLTLVNHPSDLLTIPIPALTVLAAKVQPELVLLTTLPLLMVVESENLSGLTVSGLAAVSRHLMKESNDPVVLKAMGFRGNCLQAPAECSIWTSFCEVQMIQATILFLTQQQQQDVVEIPTALVKLEEHLKQPIRMHNVVKRWQAEEPRSAAGGQLNQEEIQKLAGTLLEHTYAEGPDMTLADLILFPCVTLLSERLSVLGVNLADHLPRVAGWLTTMKVLVSFAWSQTVGETQFPDIGSLRIQSQPTVKVPRAKEVSLYKKDAARRTGTAGNLSAEEVARVIDLLKRQRLMWLEDDEANRVTTDLPEGLISHIDVTPCSDFTAKIDWSSLPDPAHPQQGHVPGKLS
jgi:glutathione S-transferase